MRSSYQAVSLALLCITIGFGLGGIMRDRQAMAQPAADRAAPRFQVSSFAGTTPQGVFHGCYVIDTATGQVWHVRSGGEPEKVVDKLQ